MNNYGSNQNRFVNPTSNLKNYFFNKRILIPGAASGIGQALSYWYLNQGATVILVSKDEAALKEMATQFPT